MTAVDAKNMIKVTEKIRFYTYFLFFKNTFKNIAKIRNPLKLNSRIRNP